MNDLSKIKKIIENVDTRMRYVSSVIEQCKLDTNKELRYLSRIEGGICSREHTSETLLQETKQLRFERYNKDDPRTITLRLRNGEWTIHELLDIRDAMVSVLDEMMDDTPLVSGFVMVQ